MSYSNFAKFNDPFMSKGERQHLQETFATSPIQPRFCSQTSLWLYGNERLLKSSLASIAFPDGAESLTGHDLLRFEDEAEQVVLSGKVLVGGIHHEAHQRTAVIPLRWGAPRIVVLPGGFFHHLGETLNQEPFRLARWWRYEWDPNTDLAVSRRAPDKLPTFGRKNLVVDRLIETIVNRSSQIQ